MATVTIHQAKTNLSRLIARAEAGEDIVIARGKEPVAKLVALPARRAKRAPGRLKGKYHLPDEFFFAPLPEEEQRLWEGRGDADPA